MASIREKKQGNKIVSYQFTCCLGRDATGKQIRRYSTWIAPKGITTSKVKKAAEREAETWEHQMKAEFDKDVRNPERAKIKEFVNEKLLKTLQKNTYNFFHNIQKSKSEENMFTVYKKYKTYVQGKGYTREYIIY